MKQRTETIVRLSPAPWGGMTRHVETRPIGPADVTNRPAKRKQLVYLAALSGAIRTQRRQEWTDGCSRALLFAVGMVIIFGLAILLR